MNRSSRIAAFTACALNLTSAVAQAPREPGYSPEFAKSLREQALVMDKLKNIQPGADALKTIVEEQAKLSASKAIANEIGDNIKSEVAGVGSPDVTVSQTINNLIRTDQEFDNSSGRRAKQPEPTPPNLTDADRAVLQSYKTASIGRCDVPALQCTPDPTHAINECGVGIPDRSVRSAG